MFIYTGRYDNCHRTLKYRVLFTELIVGSAKVLKSLPGYDETFTGLRSPGVGVDDSVREGSPVYVESLGRTLWCCLHLPED